MVFEMQRERETWDGPAAPRHWWGGRYSLAGRLTLWYAISSFLIAGISAGLLYWALVSNLQREDDDFLEGKVELVQSLLSDRLGPANPELKWEIDQTERAPHQDIKILVRLIDATGRPVMETHQMNRLLPPNSFPKPPNLATGWGKPLDVFMGEGVRHRVISAHAINGVDQSIWTIQVGLIEDEEDEFLAKFRRSLWMVLALAVVACTCVGFVIARRGLRPLQQVTGTARGIGATTLGARVNLEALPREVADLAETFNAMLARLEDSFERLSRFSADIAHELRTPINILRGETEVALGRARTEGELREVLNSNLEECTHLSRLIENLLFLARSENPSTAIQRTDVDISAELANLKDFYAVLSEEAGVRVELETPETLRAQVDRGLFQRAVGNLLENALAHTPSDGRVTISAKPRAEGGFEVVVADTGAGIPSEHLPMVFARFHRVDAARSRHTGGMGLGLAIVQSVMGLHGGEARVESSGPGEGTTFTLAFPAASLEKSHAT